MKKKVKIAIIGAGSAGLYALSKVKKETDDFILINSGPYGTTCARVGCMPSKALIRIAEYYHNREHFAKSGIENSESLKVSIPQVLQRVREQRDILVKHNIKQSIERLGNKVLNGKAEFLDKHTLLVGDDMIIAEKIIIDDKIRQNIQSNSTASIIRDAALASGMRTLRHQGVDAVLKGDTTIEEVLRVTMRMEL